MLLRKLLTGWGYSPIVVGDGRAALDILETSDPPPLALLDWMMPGLDGPSVCRAVRAKGPREKGPFLFLLSARSQKADIVSGLESGADDYLTKPFDFAELKARLDRARRVPPRRCDDVVARWSATFPQARSVASTVHSRASSDASSAWVAAGSAESDPSSIALAKSSIAARDRATTACV